MRLLIDTHVFVWLNDAPERLSPKASEFCGNRDNELYLSLVSPWEMQIKAALGKLHLDVSIREMCETQERDNGLKLLTVSLDHIARLDTLGPAHRDPFDRMLIAQAINDGMTLVTADTIFGRYPVATLWRQFSLCLLSLPS